MLFRRLAQGALAGWRCSTIDIVKRSITAKVFQTRPPASPKAGIIIPGIFTSMGRIAAVRTITR